jgi:glycosyltransferase involved in cell wall biosynthesis
MIECFLRQDYDNRELIILDDAGQYDNQEGDRWRLMSTPDRYPSLGKKRNTCMDIARVRGADAFAVWDDDDLYLPHALSATAAALERAPWSRPSQVLHLSEDRATLEPHETFGRTAAGPIVGSNLFHGQWAFRAETLLDVGGYSDEMNNGEDQELAGRLKAAGVKEADPMHLGFAPFYIYPWGGTDHLSGMGERGYKKAARKPSGTGERIPIGWSREWDKMPVSPEVKRRKF